MNVSNAATVIPQAVAASPKDIADKSMAAPDSKAADRLKAMQGNIDNLANEMTTKTITYTKTVSKTNADGSTTTTTETITYTIETDE